MEKRPGVTLMGFLGGIGLPQDKLQQGTSKQMVS